MKKKILGLLTAVIIMAAVTSYVFAGSRVDLETDLLFSSATDDKVVLSITNSGRSDIVISRAGHYIDEIGSPGSWDCSVPEEVTVRPGKTKYIEFQIEEAVTHGDNSILVFYFRHGDTWYLAKTGKKLGLEYFAEHN